MQRVAMVKVTEGGTQPQCKAYLLSRNPCVISMKDNFRVYTSDSTWVSCCAMEMEGGYTWGAMMTWLR